MPYDDDDDLFGEEFDFVDDEGSDVDDAEEKAEDESPVEEPPRRGRGKAADKPAAKPPAGGARRGAKPPASAGPAKRGPAARRDPPQPPAEEYPREEAGSPPPDGYGADDGEFADEPLPAEVPGGPPSDHVVHVYEHGKLKRTLPRKFTDEEAVSFAEEYTRTGKPYGRYAVATPDDEEPSPTFAGASAS